MKALVLEAAGEEPSLTVRELPPPTPGPGDVLVQVAACGMCYHDVAVMRGLLRRDVKPNLVLGHEISGRVAEVGSAVTSVTVGDRVVSTLTTFCGACERCLAGREYRCLHGLGIGHAIDGGFAQHVKLPESSVVPVPQEIGLEEAALLACPMGVALQAIRDVARVKAGESVLVTGAGGGLGVHAVQIASALGARVLAVTASPEKALLLEQTTSAEVIQTGELDWAEVALAMTGDRGVDVVVDTVGSAVFRSALGSLAQYGRMVLLGEVTGDRVTISLAEILFRDATILGSTGAGRRHIAEVAEMVRSGAVRPVISQRYGLEEGAAAYRLMRARKSFGRLVLIP